MSINFPQVDRDILQRWSEINAFHRQLELSQGRPRYTFSDGPPFATGLPHYGHLLASTIKDIVPRYWSMKGFHVERRFGWDTHGLPIEQQIDTKWKMSGRDLVAKIGIEGYNAECRAIVMKFATQWRQTIGRLGRWIDFDNDYKTMDTHFMESVWWVFKQLYDRDQVYREYKVMPYSTALATPLSNFEADLDRRDTKDPAIVVAFPLREDPETNLVIWTTTPWTVPSNIAIAVHPQFTYLKIHDKKANKNYIIHEDLLTTLYKDPKKAEKAGDFTKVESFLGKALVGKEYNPPFEYFYEANKNWWFRVIGADYVKADAGTGLVHQSPSFGNEDYVAATKAGIINRNRLPPNPVDEKGCFTDEVPDYVGQHVRGPAEKALIKHLTQLDRLVLNGQVSHNIAFCWRSDTPLIQKAVSAWFVNVSSIVPQMLANLEGSHWVPDFVKKHRFGTWIANARDWNISRNRFWGTPIPIWTNETFDEIVVVGSISELKELSGFAGEITDLHRHVVDKIRIPSKKGGEPLKRIDEVFDCWFESGSMPYASVHYPFAFKDQSDFLKQFPSDFVAEGLDQTRGWFYTLLILGTHLFQVSPFKNCVVNGIVLAEDGKKMSKKLNNYPDPVTVIDSFGADALRLYLINSPVVRAETLRFQEIGVKDVVSKVMLPLWNSFQFLQGQVAMLQKSEKIEFTFDPDLDVTVHGNVMDRWIQARTQSLLKFVDEEMAAYRLYTVVPRLLEMIDNLTNWYIRLNRRRLKGEAGDTNSTITGLNTLFEVLFILVRALAPFTPFISDHIYLLLVPYLRKHHLATFEDTRSVHFLPYPTFDPKLLDPDVERKVLRMQTVIILARNSRERKTISLKTPLKSLVIINSDPVYLSDLRSLESYILDEVNVQYVELSSDETQYNVAYTCDADWPSLGKKLRKEAPKVRKELPHLTTAQVKDFVQSGHITVAGIPLEREDLLVKKDVANAQDASATIATNTDDDVLTILDLHIDAGLAQDGLAREIINRVQRLRKKAGLKPTDDVDMRYTVTANPENVPLKEAFGNKRLEEVLRAKVSEDGEDGEGGTQELIVEEAQEVQKATFVLKLLKL